MSEPVAVMRQDLYNIKKHDIKTHILKHKRLICPYFFFPFNETEQKSQKDKFKKLKKGDVIIIRQTDYGSNKDDRNRYLKVKIIEDEPEFSPIPNLFLILKEDKAYFKDKHQEKEFKNFIEDIKILNDDKEIADYIKKDYQVKLFEAQNFKIEIMNVIETDDTYSNYLNRREKGSIEFIIKR